jgi:hypothetical protein
MENQPEAGHQHDTAYLGSAIVAGYLKDKDSSKGIGH